MLNTRGVSRRHGRGTATATLLLVSLVLAAGFHTKAWGQKYVFGRAEFSSGATPYGMSTADFDGDGKLDLVVTSLSGKLSILFGKDDGTFDTPVSYDVGGSLLLVRTGDFNGDGRPDIVVGRTNGQTTISVLINNGDGTFQAHVDYSSGSSPQMVVVADLNADNKPDLVASNRDSDTISVFLGKGDGTFNDAVNYAAGPYPGKLVVADLNKDSKYDLAVLNFNANTVSILLGNGTGSFGSPIPYGTGINPSTIVAADFNGDGSLDLAITDYGADTISILRGNGNGTFQTKADFATGLDPDGLETGDFNGDGKLDLAVANHTSNDISVHLGKGDGTFPTHVDYRAVSVCVDVVAADFNGDGKLDLAVTNFGSNPGVVTVLLGRGDGAFDTQYRYTTATGPGTAVMGDFKEDGKIDVATDTNGPEGTGSTVSFLAGNGDGSLQSYVAIPAGPDPAGLAAGDFNKDGHLDLVVTNYELGLGNHVSVMLGNGAGSFQAPVPYEVDYGPVLVETGDFNKDGNLDLVVANFGKDFQPTQHVSVLLGNGNGTFQNQVYYATGSAPVGIAVADFNGDTKLDLAVANFGWGSVSILMGNGDGTFGTKTDYGVGAEPGAVKAGDFNGDGKLDLAVGNSTSNNVSILIGTGTGAFQPAVNYAAIPKASWLSLGDFNTDGKLDVAVAPVVQGNTAGILFGKGDGTFEACVEYRAGSLPSWVVAGDLNADQAAEMVVSNFGENSVSVFRNLPAAAIYPTRLDFPTQALGGSVYKYIYIYNSGTAPLNLSAISITGANAADFTKTSTCGTSVASGANCRLTITFAPEAVGSRNATLSVSDNSPGSPQLIPLTGTAVAPDLIVPSLTGPSAVIPGQSISLVEGTKNEGTSTAAASLTKFYWSTNSTYETSDILLGQRSIPALAAGASSGPATTQVTVPQDAAAGNYYILAVADADNTVPESSEANNTKYLTVKNEGVTPGELIVDNAAAGQSGAGRSFTGTWCASTSSGYYGTQSLYSCGSGTDTYRWTPTLLSAGSYDVYVWWTSHANRSTAVPIAVTYAGGTATKNFNQQTQGSQWVKHGTYNFNAGTGGYVQVSDANGQACADAVRFVPATPSTPVVSIQATDNTATEAGTTTGVFTVTRTGDTSSALTVNYTVGGTATPVSDYAALPGSVVIPATSATATITVTPVDDTAVEGDETVIVTLSANAAYTVGSPSSATVTIADNDSVTPGEIILDNAAAGQSGGGRSFTGTWCASTSAGYYGTNSLYSCGSGTDTYRWTPTIPSAGSYDVYIWWTAHTNRSSTVPIAVTHAGGTTTYTFNEKTGGAQWVKHGTYSFNAGTGSYVEVSDANGQASADAVRFVPAGAPPSEIILDNAAAGQSGGGRSFSGTWCASTSAGYYGTNSLYSCGSGTDTYRWTPTIPSAGSYDVYIWWTSHTNRSTTVPIAVTHAGGTTTHTYNQRTGGGQWVKHGTYSFNAGTGGFVEVSDVNGQASADAVRFVPAGAPPTEILLDNAAAGQSGGGRSFTGAWCASTSAGYYGTNSLYSCGSGLDTYRWTPTIPSAGSYKVYVWWTSHANRSTSVPISVTYAGGAITQNYNQQLNGGQWVVHGTYSFNAGTDGYVQVTDANGQACADAVRFVKQ